MSPVLSISTSPSYNMQSEIVIEQESISPVSTRPFSPTSIGRDSWDSAEDSDAESDESTPSNLTFSFGDWHTSLDALCTVEFDDEDGAQLVLIPSSSPFFLPPQLNFDKQFASDCSLPSVCPTLSGKFDLLHSDLPFSPGAVVPSLSTGVVIFDSEPVLGDGFPSNVIHVMESVSNKTLPDFPEDAIRPTRIL